MSRALSFPFLRARLREMLIYPRVSMFAICQVRAKALAAIRARMTLFYVKEYFIASCACDRVSLHALGNVVDVSTGCTRNRVIFHNQNEKKGAVISMLWRQ